MCCPGTACSNGEGRPGRGARAGRGVGGEHAGLTALLPPPHPAGLCTPPEPPPGVPELDEPGPEALPRRTPAPAWPPDAKGKYGPGERRGRKAPSELGADLPPVRR